MLDGLPFDSFMRVRLTQEMSDTEIDALWAYLQTVPPQPMGTKACPLLAT